MDPRLGAPGQPYYKGQYFIAGTISENNAGNTLYPWYGIPLGSGPPPWNTSGGGAQPGTTGGGTGSFTGVGQPGTTGGGQPGYTGGGQPGVTGSGTGYPTGGNLVWGPESHAAVPVSDGLFNVGLGSLTSGGIPTTVWNGDRYLEVTVNGETLEPRELIRSVPIAGMALTVPDGAIGTTQIADGAVTPDKASGFVISGGENMRTFR